MKIYELIAELNKLPAGNQVHLMDNEHNFFSVDFVALSDDDEFHYDPHRDGMVMLRGSEWETE